MRDNLTSSNWMLNLRRGMTDLWFLLSVLLAALIFIVLLGYHPDDPGWSGSGTGEGVKHWLGITGAYIADALMSFFGYASYLIPIGLFTIGWQSAKRDYIDTEMMIWNGVGLIMAICALCGIFAFHWQTTINSVAITGGGLLGQKMTIELLKVCSTVWVMIIYTLILIGGATLLFECSWVNILERLGRPFEWAWLWYQRRNGDYTPLDEMEQEGRSSLKERLFGGRMSQEDSEFLESLSHSSSIRQDELEEPTFRSWQEVKAQNARKEAEESTPPSSFWQRTEGDDEDFFAQRSSSEAHFDDGMIDVSDVGMAKIEHEQELSLADMIDNPSAYTASHTSAEHYESHTTFTPLADEGSEPLVFNSHLGEDEDWEKEDDYPQAQERIAPEEGARGMKVRLPFGNQNFSSHSKKSSTYALPPLNLLTSGMTRQPDYNDEEIDRLAHMVEEALRTYRIKAKVMNVSVGPVVTRLELDLAPGVKVSQISNLDKDLARSLSVGSVRVVEVIPGKPYIGLEIPNRKREVVHVRAILESEAYRSSEPPLTLVLGVDIAGAPVVANLAKMPHLLVAGTTGSGKSVAINVMLASMLYQATPEELRLILIDPKMLEMSMYEHIPHLLTPVVTDMNEAENALRWAVAEMERRYQLMAAFRVRNIAGFNEHIRERQAKGERVDDPLWNPEDFPGLANRAPEIEPLPYIVIVIDELADMMMAVGKKVEELIARIAQKARAAGIHLILATQRPSVDVITGLIKANVPTRLAFQVSSKIDSRTILDQQGAETLLGYGDGLFMLSGREPQRVHGALIEDGEVDRLTTYLRTQGEPKYEDAILAPVAASALGAFGGASAGEEYENDTLYDEACQVVIESGKASISYLQRRLSIGYNRAARLIETMEEAGIVSPVMGRNGARKVLVGQSDNF